MHPAVNDLISRIYDCAVEPSGWDRTLQALRDHLSLAYVGLSVVAFEPAKPPRPVLMRGTDWDADWIARLVGAIDSLPGFERMRLAPLDQPMLFRDFVGAEVFDQSPFRRDWVEPQGLRDACNVPVLQRPEMTAMLTAWAAQGRAPLSTHDAETLAAIAPHLRRAVLIGEQFAQARAEAAIGSNLLNSLATAVFLLADTNRITWANDAAQALLSDAGHLRAPGGRLGAAASAAARPLGEALARAALRQDAAMESWGCALILPAARAASDIGPALAYVLPFGTSAIRHDMGLSVAKGMSAVLVVAPGMEAPPPVELVAAFLGLTAAEARVALAIATGQNTATAAASLGIGPNTIRKHLANIFTKTGLRDRAALAAAVARMRLPVLR